MGKLRLLPVVIMTALMLLGLKSINLLTGDYTRLTGTSTAQAQDADPEESADGEMTAEDMAEATTGDDQAVDEALASADTSDEVTDTTILPIETSRDVLLERLGERRVMMEEREQDLRVREQLLEAAEQRLEQRLAELAALEERVQDAVQSDEERANEEIGRLVQLYSAMRAKDAAAIFDGLDLGILVEVASAMNPRKMADILGNMEPDAARRLTIAMAGPAPQMAAQPSEPNSDLPRIEGLPIQ
jgi:flagellar motility protein MotE (MotC chaperone)